MNQLLATVISNSRIQPDMYLLRVQAPQIASQAQPGQFVMVRTSDDHDPLLRRPLAIHRVSPLSSLEEVALLYRVVGRGTAWLARRAQGDRVDLFGPLGNGFHVSSDNLLLVAGGAGIAPLVALSEKELARGAAVSLIMGAPTKDELYPVDLLPSRVKLHLATEDGSAGRKGLASDLAVELAGGFDQVFACGPVAMYEAMSKHAALHGKSVQVSMEARMGCGFGVCLGCAIDTREGTKLVCQDGPVFELEQVFWRGHEGGD